MAQSSETQPAPESSESARPDPTLGPRRLLVWVIAFAIGSVATALGMIATDIPLDETLPISFLYIPLLPLAAIPAGFFFLIWVDYFMGTQIVPD